MRVMEAHGVVRIEEESEDGKYVSERVCSFISSNVLEKLVLVLSLIVPRSTLLPVD